MRKTIAMLLAAAMLLALVGCGETPAETTASTTLPQSSSDQKIGYTVSVSTKGGMALSGLDVFVYGDSALTDMKGFAQTDAQGNVSLQLAAGGEYYIQVTGAPKGYQVEKFYQFSGLSASIVLDSQLVEGEDLANASLGLGDVMYDFTVTTPAGEKVTLSQLLAEKEMVLLNFWYTTCQYCVAEFPYMEEAYQQYSDKVGIVALNPYDADGEIKGFQENMGLSFNMASCNVAWPGAFGIQAYPTSVVVDRYGVICLIEAGGITSLRPFVSMFETFTTEDYQQQLYNELGELVTTVVPTYEMDTSENIGALINSGEIEVTYRPAIEEEFSWPFIAAQKDGEDCLKASNQLIDSSYAILYADVTLKAGQAVGFDYLVSSESGSDILHVIVNQQAIYSISGTNDPEIWESCYPWVAEEDGVYEVALCYIKDGSTNEGDDTVYIKNMRVCDPSEIATETYLPRYAAVSADGFDYSYVSVVLNETDGFYHVGTADGPLLLADLMNLTQFNEEKSVWYMVNDNMIVKDGHDYYEELVDFCSLASNSALNGVTPVNEELASYLKIVAEVAGFEDDENEWLKICKYYQSYGGDGAQLQNPILGLSEFCPLLALEGKNVESNFFYYDRALLPRGKVAQFIPERSGAYRITSRSESVSGVEGWIFFDNMDKENPDYVFEGGERMYTTTDEVSMVIYMEAGRSYYIDICFWDMYETGTIAYDIEFLGSTYDLFTACAPGYFTYDSDATGDAMYYLIAKNVPVVLGEDGYYYEDLGLDANGKQKYGSAIYADFVGTNIFSGPIATVQAYNADGTLQRDENGDPVMISGMIDMGNFDFSKNENDMYILSFLEEFDGDAEATDAHLREIWGADYDVYAELYQLEDVYEGKYHGTGEDLTEEMKGYLSKIITSGAEELRGCVKVDARLAEILQELMNKYTFQGVDYAWTKLCYYYDHLAPEA